MVDIVTMDTNLISGFILIITVYFVKDIQNERTKIKMFWVLFFMFAIIFNILANM